MYNGEPFVPELPDGSSTVLEQAHIRRSVVDNCESDAVSMQ